MKASAKQLCYAAAETVVVAGVHWFLIYWLAEKNVVAALFAAGPHLPKMTTVLAVCFVLVRVVTVLVVPAMIAGRLARAYVLWRAERCQPQ